MTVNDFTVIAVECQNDALLILGYDHDFVVRYSKHLLGNAFYIKA